MNRKLSIFHSGCPDSLRRLLDMDFPEREEIAQRIARREGTLTTSVRGSHVSVTVRLRRRWAMMLRWTPTGEQLRRIGAWFECIGKAAEDTLKVAVILVGIYLLIEIGAAFLPGGSVERVLGGLR